MSKTDVTPAERVVLAAVNPDTASYVTEDIRTALEMLKEYVEKDEDDPDPGASRDLLRWAVDGVERLERALAAYKEAESVERREWLAELWRRETPTPARWRGLDWII